MGRHFFTGGIMPSDDLLLHFAGPVELEDHWRISARTTARQPDWLRDSTPTGDKCATSSTTSTARDFQRMFTVGGCSTLRAELFGYATVRVVCLSLPLLIG